MFELKGGGRGGCLPDLCGDQRNTPARNPGDSIRIGIDVAGPSGWGFYYIDQ